MEEILKNWCDSNIAINLAYRGSIPLNEPISLISETEEERIQEKMIRPGKLLYQDGTACSASFAFADVYLLESGEYLVYVAHTCVKYQGGGYENICLEKTIFKTLAQVIDYLAEYSGHDPNSCGELIDYIHKSTRPPQKNSLKKGYNLRLSQNEKSQTIQSLILEYGARPYNQTILETSSETESEI